MLLKKGKILLAFVLLFFFSISLSIWSDYLFFTGVWTNLWLLVFVILSIFQLAFFIWYARKQNLIKGRFSFLGWKSLKISLLGFLFIALGNRIIGLLLDLMGMGIETTANQTAIEETMKAGYPFLLLFVQGVVLAPIIEEIVFRGILGDLLCDRNWHAYVVSASLFSMAHGPTDIGSFLVYLWPGLVFYWVRQKADYLESAMVTHMMMNGLAFLATYLVTTGLLTP